MKHLKRYTLLCPKILLLRYGIERPLLKINALFSMAAVAIHLNIKTAEAYAIEAKYFRDLAAAPFQRNLLS
jgi:hypothetical protein